MELRWLSKLPGGVMSSAAMFHTPTNTCLVLQYRVGDEWIDVPVVESAEVKQERCRIAGMQNQYQPADRHQISMQNQYQPADRHQISTSTPPQTLWERLTGWL